MVVAYKATNIPKNKLASWGASARNSVYVCHSTSYPLPDRLINKLKASQTLVLTTGAAGVFASSQIRLNDASDILAAIGSIQPRFYDQLSALYANCCVYGVKVNIKVLDVTPTGGSLRLIFVPTRNTTVPIADCYADGNELPGTMRFDMGGIPQNGTTFFTNTERKEQQRYYDIGSFWGKSRQQVLTEEGFDGLAGASPTYQVYGYFCVQQLSGGTQESVTAELTVTLYTAWSNVIAVGTST